MAWRRAGPRPLWRSLVDGLVFLSVLFIVVLLMQKFNVLAVDTFEFGAGKYDVIDGDSLRKGQTEIRLVGIDAPEYRQSCTNGSGKAYPCGKEAASALRVLVGGSDVTCESHEVDRYRRALSTCHIKDMNINQEMVRQGWAVAYALRGDISDYALDENEARRLKRGVWQGTFETPSAYRKRQRAVQSNVNAVAEPDD
jgi:endonuclease YncB( thermonuclease family)